MGMPLRHGAAVGMAFGLLLGGCGIQPYKNPNEAKKPGIFSGPEGEWVIYRKYGPLPDSERKHADASVDDADVDDADADADVDDAVQVPSAASSSWKSADDSNGTGEDWFKFQDIDDAWSSRAE